MRPTAELHEQYVWQWQSTVGSMELRLVAATDLDAATEARARSELRAALHHDDWQACLIDASEVFVDVRGLAIVLEGAALAASRDCDFAIVAPASVRTMCRVLRLDRHVRLLDAGPSRRLSQDPAIREAGEDGHGR